MFQERSATTEYKTPAFVRNCRTTDILRPPSAPDGRRKRCNVVFDNHSFPEFLPQQQSLLSSDRVSPSANELKSETSFIRLLSRDIPQMNKPLKKRPVFDENSMATDLNLSIGNLPPPPFFAGLKSVYNDSKPQSSAVVHQNKLEARASLAPLKLPLRRRLSASCA